MSFDFRSAFLGLIGFTIFGFIAIPSGEPIQGDTDATKNIASLPEFDMAAVEVNNDVDGLLSRYVKLSTRPKKETPEPERVKPAEPVKVVDKTIFPFFEQFDNDHQMGLVGTFFDEQPLAVIQLINFETRATSYHEVKTGQVFGRFSVTNILREEVFLQFEGRELSLTMFNKGTGQ